MEEEERCIAQRSMMSPVDAGMSFLEMAIGYA
jgi:hypothetical protein